MEIKYSKIYSIFVVAMIALAGCEKEGEPTLSGETLDIQEPLPEYVYVPTNDVVSKVVVRADREADVGDWVELRATRDTSGHWEKVKWSELAEGVQWYPFVPNGLELEVAANLSWKVEPSENYRFDVASLQDINSMHRKVKFSKPGVYKLQAYSAYPIRSTSNLVEIRVD